MTGSSMWRVSGARVAVSILLLAVVIRLIRFALDGHIGFSLADEGALWYGVQQVLRGGVPIRDFASYDPARYYWAAACLWLFHTHGIVAVRAATIAFSTIGVACGGWLVWQGSPHRSHIARGGLCLLAMLLCTLWMVPRWKNYDSAASLILVVSLIRVLKHPVPKRFLAHGVVVGLIAVLGRNHGVYGVVAGLLAAPLLVGNTTKTVWRHCIAAWAGGIVLGYSPVLVGIALDHRFAVMFWKSIQFLLFDTRAGELPLSVPWPWRAGIHPLSPTLLEAWAVGCWFLVLPLFCLLGTTALVYEKWRERTIRHPVFASCVVTAIPYLNVAFSRADPVHLAQATLPVLIGIMIFPWGSRTKTLGPRFVWPALVILSLYVALPLHPRFAMESQGNWRPVAVDGELIWMSPLLANTVDGIEKLAREYLRPGGTVFSAPVWPGVYALLGVTAPVYYNYPIFPRNDETQGEEIQMLRQAKPQLVLINTIALDGRDELRYVNTHPLVWRYILMHYRQIASPKGEPEILVYVPH
ncbi:MAG TPA: hypothetical protein VFU48_05080 [Nitrospira sp.]|nr:hypothetical protein [Nitrospira sp.]